ncbi:type IV pilus modification PilV family protein [Domibacillus robiginosus]|uniref:type IV pilus modification PilV family protein n=1 Tax=Domibacillus robiginosus TaxID=1071054 RepID=UPI00067DA3F6|nr:type II secretion system protein [Domibacillus robiginosus]
MTKKIKNCQDGVTLLELLVSLTILSIILLSVTRFFFQAGTFNAANESRTIALNVARNALMFMEKQSFVEMRHEFEDPDTVKWLKMCPGTTEDKVYTLQSDRINEADCSDIPVNDGTYAVTITSSSIDEETKKYYIPVTVKVRWKENEPEVELDGTIKSEDMR